MGMYLQANRPFAVTTVLDPDALLLVGFTGREALSQLFVFHLELMAENSRPVAFERLLGSDVSVRVLLPDGEQRFFNGICSRLSQGSRDSVFTTYRMEVVPQVWLLTRTAQSRIFQQKSVPEILAEVFDGFDVEFQLQGKFEPRD